MSTAAATKGDIEALRKDQREDMSEIRKGYAGLLDEFSESRVVNAHDHGAVKAGLAMLDGKIEFLVQRTNEIESKLYVLMGVLNKSSKELEGKISRLRGSRWAFNTLISFGVMISGAVAWILTHKAALKDWIK